MLRRFSATLVIALVSLLVLAGQALGREFRITTTDDLVRAAAGLALAAGPDAGQTPKPGDTLVVMSGSYNLGPNTVRVTLENLTIRSNEGSHATVLQGAGVVLSVEANGVTIGGLTANQGFKITGGSTCVKIQASDFVTIQNNLIASCGEGVILQGALDNVLIRDNEIRNNATGVSISGRITNVLINGNVLAGNTQWGVDARGVSSGLVDARDNWWGEPAGPYHPTENPYGVGNRVSDNVNFKPWLAVPARPTGANFQILSLTGPTRVAQGTTVQYVTEIKNIGVAEGAQEIKFTVSKKVDGANIPTAVHFATWTMTISS